MLGVMGLRCIASLATENADGSIHLTAIWFTYEDGALYVATSSRSRKARNIQARAKATLMVDVRKPGKERGVTAAGTARLITGPEAEAINRKIYARYLSAEAMADPHIVPTFAKLDDATIRITPESWFSWDLAEADAQFFEGRLFANPHFMLPLD
jgi:nitroimidazol reductase NimA-like FMN-containing flavoprotein (pyridoxamine 5'-phosphate oxidase superfamily)